MHRARQIRVKNYGKTQRPEGMNSRSFMYLNAVPGWWHYGKKISPLKVFLSVFGIKMQQLSKLCGTHETLLYRAIAGNGGYNIELALFLERATNGWLDAGALSPIIHEIRRGFTPPARLATLGMLDDTVMAKDYSRQYLRQKIEILRPTPPTEGTD